MSDRKGDWIQVGVTKRKFYPLDPRPEDVDIRDIAHALSNVCRFAGHTRFHYSVAQHSFLASVYAPPESALPALLHDAAEAYMGDIARPWKKFLYLRNNTRHSYRQIKLVESSLLDVILTALKCPNRLRSEWAPVEEIDMRLLATEARDLMSPLADEWSNTFHKSPCEARYAFNPYPEPIAQWDATTAKRAFLDRYRELTSSLTVPECPKST